MRVTLPRPAAAIAVVLTAALTSACTISIGASTAAPSGATGTTSPTAPKEPTTLPPGTSGTNDPAIEGTTGPGLAITAIDLGPAGSQTAAGSVLELGTPAWFTQSGTVDGEEIVGIVGVTLLEVRELGREVFDVTSDPSVFEAYTPFALELCGLDLPAYDPETQTMLTCIVGLSDDLDVVGMKWVGEAYGYTEATEGNPYFEAPVAWR